MRQKGDLELFDLTGNFRGNFRGNSEIQDKFFVTSIS
jgi:hypothetical protein